MNIDRQLIWMIAATAGYGALAIPISRQGRRRGVGAYLSLYVLFSAVWALARGVSDWVVVGSVFRAIAYQGLSYGIVLLSCLLGILTRSFLSQESSRTWVWFAGGGILLAAMGVLDMCGVHWMAWSAVFSPSLSSSLGIVGWACLSGTAYFLTWQAYRHTHKPLHRNRLRYWMLILVLTISGDSLFMLFGFPYDELGTMLHWCGAALASIALLMHHLPDLTGIARYGVRYFLLTLATALFFFGGILLIQQVSESISLFRDLIISVAGIALLWAVLYPLLHQGVLRVLVVCQGSYSRSVLGVSSHGES